MRLSDWLLKNGDCDDEQRIILALRLTQVLNQFPDGHVNLERLELDEHSFELKPNGDLKMLDEYSAPELLSNDQPASFASAVFSYGTILDELLRGSSYCVFQGWDATTFLDQVNGSGDWFIPFEDDPLEDIVTACLQSDPAARPQSLEELIALLKSNDDVANYLRDNKLPWFEQNAAPDVEQQSDQSDQFEQSAQQTEDDEEEEPTDAGIAIGIDLGTSNSTVAYYDSGKFHYTIVDQRRLIPSAIFFKEHDKNSWLYGTRALRRGKLYPDSLCTHFKRHIGENTPLEFRYEPQGKASTNQTRRYVVDTNFFVDDPFIIENMKPDDRIIIPKVVYQELERRSNSPDTADAASAAIDSIEKFLEQGRIELADSKVELLPTELFTSNDRNNNDRNDSKILSVALSYDDPQTILLSNDNGIAQKATWFSHKFQIQNRKEFDFYLNAQDNSPAPDMLSLTGKDCAVIFLKHLRDLVTKDIGYVSKAVITVPEGFSAIQRNEIKQAGFEAGFSEIELHSEPKAAAVAYGLDQRGDKKTLLIYDFGGGTFDVTIFSIDDGEFKVLAHGGDPKLGGEDFTQAIIDDFKEKLLDGELLPNEQSFDMTDEEASGLSHDEFAKNEQRIWEACEDIKCRLSTSEDEKKSIQLYLRPGERQEVEYELSRDEFKEITTELRGRAQKEVDKTLNQAGLKIEDIDAVIMAGGTSTIPFVAQSVKRHFGDKHLFADRDPATLIAEGAALFADIKWNENSTIDKQIKVFDNTLSDLGVSLRGRKFDCVVPTGEALPLEREKIYSLVQDDQQELNIECYERDAGSKSLRTIDEDVNYIGRVLISNLPPLKRNAVDVIVTFRLTKEYELQVDVNLKDKQGRAIEQTSVKIETLGV